MAVYIYDDKKKTQNLSKEEVKMDKSTEDKQQTSGLRRAEDRERLTVLEYRVNDHEEEIRSLVIQQAEFSSSLNTIVTNLTQIKYTLIGALGILIITKYGLLEGIIRFLPGL